MPLLALFGGAALWLVVGLVLALLASLTFHAPEIFARLPVRYLRPPRSRRERFAGLWFCDSRRLGVILWIFARLSQAELVLPLVPVVAANLWHLGVFIGLATILCGGSSGFAWLEFPRAAAMLLGVPLFSSRFLRWPRSASARNANLSVALVPARGAVVVPVDLFHRQSFSCHDHACARRGAGGHRLVVCDNLDFCLARAGWRRRGILFPAKNLRSSVARPLLRAVCFLDVDFLRNVVRIPQGAPVPAWLPTTARLLRCCWSFRSLPLRSSSSRRSGVLRSSAKAARSAIIKFGITAFIFSGLMLIASACPEYSRMLEFTWFGQAQTQLQILGFFAIVFFGAIYEILPRLIGGGCRCRNLSGCNISVFMLGTLLLVVLAGVRRCGARQGGDIASGGGIRRDCASARRAGVLPARQPFVCREHFCDDDPVETRRWSKR